MHEHEHYGEAHLTPQGNPLKLALIIVLVIMLVEIVGGLLSNSLALVSDAAHMLIDALALGLSLFAMTIAKRPATARRTYGYHRAEILAALVNGVTVFLVSLYIFYEAYQRFLTPPTVNTAIMLPVAVIGLIANMAVILILRRSTMGSLNIKAAFWHVVGDTLSSVGVIIAAIVIALTGWSTADPILAVLIGAIILWGAVSLVRESVNILAEAVPPDIELDKVTEAIKAVPGVEDVHDLHVWTITSGVPALSAHLLITDRQVSRSTEIVNAVNQNLQQQFHISHATLQLECDRCEGCPDGLICDLNKLKSRNH